MSDSEDRLSREMLHKVIDNTQRHIGTYEGRVANLEGKLEDIDRRVLRIEEHLKVPGDITKTVLSTKQASAVIVSLVGGALLVSGSLWAVVGRVGDVKSQLEVSERVTIEHNKREEDRAAAQAKLDDERSINIRAILDEQRRDLKLYMTKVDLIAQSLAAKGIIKP